MADTYYPVRITRKQAGTNKKHRFYAVIPIDSDCPHESFNLVAPSPCGTGRVFERFSQFHDTSTSSDFPKTYHFDQGSIKPMNLLERALFRVWRFRESLAIMDEEVKRYARDSPIQTAVKELP